MSARGWSNYTPKSYMRDEEREANRRMRRRDPIKAEREEAFRAGLSGDWRDAKPGRPIAEEPHSLLDSWPFLIPFGLMCLGVLLWQAGVFKP